MTITRLEYLDHQDKSSRQTTHHKSKVNVYIDYEYAFWLFEKEIIQYQLEAGKEVNSLIYDEIIQDIILYRAKQKAVSVLKFMDRTENELRKKLSEERYSQDIIDTVLAYVIDYGYINDERYASVYIRTKKNTKSKMIIRMELIKKGIKKEILDTVMVSEYEAEESEDPEILAIKKAISKKSINSETLTWEDKQKLIASLYRKGFGIDKINRALM